ncbi:MAG: NUDIX domain-containing protein [Actinomycetota bacterium]|nr:NUDIX domain-containing protein [Actinomycetota bacterium]
MRGPLPQAEFEAIFSRVPRLTVEVVIADPGRGVLLALRESGPCQGLWHLPGGTVRFGEPVRAAVARVADGELGLAVTAGELLGYIEYPSHYEHGLDSPVGLAFAARATSGPPTATDLRGRCEWFARLPGEIHDEQRAFLTRSLGLS